MSESTATEAYTQRLVTLETVWWKRLIPVQLPYKLHLQRLKPGFMLEVGCGIGRNLAHVEGKGVGVDHNPQSIDVCRAKGFTAFLADDFHKSKFSTGQQFDSILLAHVLEHMSFEDGIKVLKEYLPYLKKDGKLILICPQEAGFATDKTHVEYMSRPKLVEIMKASGIRPLKDYSYPFPGFVGRFFTYNENVAIGLKN